MPKQYGGPGPRLMYPSTAWSLSLSKCDPMAQLLFDRLCFCGADDQGRMVADPEVVRGQCMPLVKGVTAPKVAVWLDQLEQAQDEEGRGMILRYEAGGHPLLQLVNWWECQSSMRRAYPSRWPAPPDWEDRVFGLPSQPVNGSPRPPATSGQRAGKVRAHGPQSAADSEQGAGAARAECVQGAADSGHDAPLSRARAANRTEGTYVPRTEVSPLPPSLGVPEQVLDPEIAGRAAEIRAAVESPSGGIYGTVVLAKDSPRLLQWASIRRGGDLVDLDEILECARRRMRTPTPDGTPPSLGWAHDAVMGLARQRLDAGLSAGSPQQRATDARIAELMGGHLPVFGAPPPLRALDGGRG